MNKYIQDWLDVIEYMNNDNTYKLAWGDVLFLRMFIHLITLKKTM